MRIAFGIGSLLLLLTTASAQSTPATPPPCTLPESKLLDFWVGEWNLT
jgi:hypothetical protein